MKWISVKDKLPKEFKDVLALSDDGLMQVCFVMENIYGEYVWDSMSNIVFWMKLPNRPNKELYLSK